MQPRDVGTTARERQLSQALADIREDIDAQWKNACENGAACTSTGLYYALRVVEQRLDVLFGPAAVTTEDPDARGDAADIVMSPHFDGVTYDPDRDHERLAKQRGRVYRCLRVDRWWTLADLAAAAQAPEASVSARIRDLRKPRFGSFTIDKRYAGNGLWEYRMDPEDGIVDCAA